MYNKKLGKQFFLLAMNSIIFQNLYEFQFFWKDFKIYFRNFDKWIIKILNRTQQFSRWLNNFYSCRFEFSYNVILKNVRKFWENLKIIIKIKELIWYEKK